MAKFDMQSVGQNIFFVMSLLHSHAHYICIVCAKYQKASVKALLQVDFFTNALSKHKNNPYFSIGNRKKNGYVHKALIWSKINVMPSNFFTQIFNVSVLCKQT